MVKGMFLTEEDLKNTRIDFQTMFWDVKKVMENLQSEDKEIKTLLEKTLANLDGYYHYFGGQ